MWELRGSLWLLPRARRNSFHAFPASFGLLASGPRVHAEWGEGPIFVYMLFGSWGVGSCIPCIFLMSCHVPVLAGLKVLGSWEIPLSGISNMDSSMDFIRICLTVVRISAVLAYISTSLARALSARFWVAGPALIYFNSCLRVSFSSIRFKISGGGSRDHLFGGSGVVVVSYTFHGES